MIKITFRGFYYWLAILFCSLPALSAATPASNVQAGLPTNMTRIHYNRIDFDYDGWGLHVWGDNLDIGRDVSWEKPLLPKGRDAFGIYFDIPVKPRANQINFILHHGDSKNVARDMVWSIREHGSEIWQAEDDPAIYSSQPRLVNGIVVPGSAGKVAQQASGPAAPTTTGPAAAAAAVSPPATGATSASTGPVAALAPAGTLAQLQAQLLSEQQGRQVAEQLVKQREQALAESQQEVRRREAQLQDQLQKLTSQLQQANATPTHPGAATDAAVPWWPIIWLVTLALWAGSVLLLRRRWQVR
jgi:hypothetical protein